MRCPVHTHCYERLAIILFITLLPLTAFSGETDQYLAWDKDLADAAPVINAYLNEQLEQYIHLANTEYPSIDSPYDFTTGFYFYLFNGLHAARVKDWIKNTDDIETYPSRDVGNISHMRQSIYKGLTFPFILPMSRTINVNGIHLGIDKIMHFFGFGRRYYKNYTKYLENGLSETEAMEKMIRHGLTIERYMVGGLTDGIVAYADLEANYQGFRFARVLCEGTDPYVALRDGQWTRLRPIDICPYITPQYDESYYTSKYQGRRRRQVEQQLEEKYDLDNPPPAAVTRFKYYATFPQSFSTQVLASTIAEHGGGIPEQYARLD